MQISGKRVDNSHIDKKEVKGFDDFLCEITDPVTKFFETLGKNFLWLLLIALCIALVTIIGIGVFMIHPLLGIILLLITGIYVLMMILK
jgi:hypothetical protein